MCLILVYKVNRGTNRFKKCIGYVKSWSRGFPCATRKRSALEVTSVYLKNIRKRKSIRYSQLQLDHASSLSILPKCYAKQHAPMRRKQDTPDRTHVVNYQHILFPSLRRQHPPDDSTEEEQHRAPAVTPQARCLHAPSLRGDRPHDPALTAATRSADADSKEGQEAAAAAAASSAAAQRCQLPALWLVGFGGCCFSIANGSLHLH